MNEFMGRTAFVTGAASGIGLGIARQLALAGANVVLCDIRADALEAASRTLAPLGAQILVAPADVSDRKSLASAADLAEQRFGPVHLLFNNAGVAMHGVPLDAVSPADWDFVISVNIYGVIHGIEIFVPRMKRHGEGGHIVNTASIGGLQVNPSFLTGPYSMTKYAVVALSEALEQELAGSGIGVSVLCPAAVDTGIHLSARARPARLGGPFQRSENHFMGELIRGGLTGDAVGARILAAIRNNEFFILTHHEPRGRIEARHRRIMEAFDRAAEWERSETESAAVRRRRAS